MRTVPDAIIGFRTPKHLKQLLVAQARQDGTTLSELMRTLAIDGLHQRRYQAADAASQRSS